MTLSSLPPKTPTFPNRFHGGFIPFEISFSCSLYVRSRNISLSRDEARQVYLTFLLLAVENGHEKRQSKDHDHHHDDIRRGDTNETNFNRVYMIKGGGLCTDYRRWTGEYPRFFGVAPAKAVNKEE
jgi:hypothetical protein